MVEAGPEDGGYEEARRYNLIPENEGAHHDIEDFSDQIQQESFSQEYWMAYDVARTLEQHYEETGEEWVVQIREDGLQPLIYMGEDEKAISGYDGEIPEVADVEKGDIQRTPNWDFVFDTLEVGSQNQGLIVSKDLKDFYESRARQEIRENFS